MEKNLKCKDYNPHACECVCVHVVDKFLTLVLSALCFEKAFTCVLYNHNRFERIHKWVVPVASVRDDTGSVSPDITGLLPGLRRGSINTSLVNQCLAAKPVFCFHLGIKPVLKQNS